MKILQSSKYMTCGVAVYGGSMTSGPDKGLLFKGAIMSPFPISGIPLSITEQTSTIKFRQSYSGFYNLNNVFHLKVDGCMLASPSLDSVIGSGSQTMFGPTFLFKSGSLVSEVNNFVMQGGTLLLDRHFEGQYNNCTSGIWYFALGISWISADTVVYVIGQPDLLNGSFNGTYQFTARQFITTPLGYQERAKVFVTDIRTSLVTSSVALDSMKAKIVADLSKRTYCDLAPYNDYNSIIGVAPGVRSLPSFPELSVDNFFPASDRNPNWADLANRAYKSVPFFDGNGIAYIKDLAGMKAAVLSTSKLIGSLINSKATARVVANLFLAFYYGWKLFVMDSLSVADTLRKFTSVKPYQKCSSNLTYEVGPATYTSYFHCYYTRFGRLTSDMDRLVSLFDAKLSLSNIWDFIPFSFVIDWFIQVGDLLESIDSFGSMTQDHRITCSGQSIKCHATTSSARLGLKGWVGIFDVSYYERSYSDTIFYPSLILGVTNQSLHHLVEGTALIVSKR